jgi:SulP family sulfate permease
MFKDLTPMLFRSLKGYTKKQFFNDVISGIIVAIIALPLSIALAIASGVGPQEGLYTAIIAGFLISFLGGSTVQIAGPTAAFATIVAGIVATKGPSGLMLATIMAGILLVLMGLFRLGSLIKYIPYTITTGFTAGIAVTILVGQLKDFFGLTYANGVSPIETPEKIEAFFAHLSTVNPYAILVGAISLAILILWPKLKYANKIPASMIAVLVGIAMVSIFKLPVNTIEEVSGGFPAFRLPEFSFKLVKDVLPDAFTIAMLAAIESLLSCVVADGMTNTKHNSNTELVAQGIGNLGSAFFGGIPATGAIARTAANVKNGGRTPIAGMVHAVVLLVVLLLLMPYASLIPMPIIASILFIVAYNMSEWRHFVSICKTKKVVDIVILSLTFILTVVFNLVIAIAVGLVLHYAIFFALKLINKKKQTQN